ncbi:uncharacterized protein LOC126621422 isoform X2 [Malus sylvestris]|uniref:uncharacterized protein LOC126621422 isoform X2 n=1 Tax=Malus sylvestris TaxID=3752 RepID=UPI0021AC4B03|nr:uncharacterized protein LOC126621422 isoform X2 [Malus sylvestris]
MASTQNQSAHVDLFDAYFRRADLDRDGRISGNEAVAFFQGSGLPKQVLAQFREGRPLPAVLPSNIMFDLSHFFQPSNNYSNAGNVAWRPASGFQQQQLMPGPGARHMASPAGGRPPKTVAPSHAEEKQQAN